MESPCTCAAAKCYGGVARSRCQCAIGGDSGIYGGKVIPIVCFFAHHFAVFGVGYQYLFADQCWEFAHAGYLFPAFGGYAGAIGIDGIERDGGGIGYRCGGNQRGGVVGAARYGGSAPAHKRFLAAVGSRYSGGGRWQRGKTAFAQTNSLFYSALRERFVGNFVFPSDDAVGALGYGDGNIFGTQTVGNGECFGASRGGADVAKSTFGGYIGAVGGYHQIGGRSKCFAHIERAANALASNSDSFFVRKLCDRTVISMDFGASTVHKQFAHRYLICLTAMFHARSGNHNLFVAIDGNNFFHRITIVIAERDFARHQCQRGCADECVIDIHRLRKVERNGRGGSQIVLVGA